MLGNRFYNQSFRKLIIAFGQVFNNIVIQRTNSTGGVTARIKVPLAYAPKEKFLVRLDQQANLNSREFATSLPRMGFEITGLAYDPSRKLTRVQKYSQVKSGEYGKKVNFNYTLIVHRTKQVCFSSKVNSIYNRSSSRKIAIITILIINIA